MTRWWRWLDRLLEGDPHDVGCDDALAVLPAYVDLLCAGIDSPARYPGAAAHFAACESCAQLMQGVMVAARDHRPDD